MLRLLCLCAICTLIVGMFSDVATSQRLDVDEGDFIINGHGNIPGLPPFNGGFGEFGGPTPSDGSPYPFREGRRLPLNNPRVLDTRDVYQIPRNIPRLLPIQFIPWRNRRNPWVLPPGRIIGGGRSSSTRRTSSSLFRDTLNNFSSSSTNFGSGTSFNGGDFSRRLRSFSRKARVDVDTRLKRLKSRATD